MQLRPGRGGCSAQGSPVRCTQRPAPGTHVRPPTGSAAPRRTGRQRHARGVLAPSTCGPHAVPHGATPAAPAKAWGGAPTTLPLLCVPPSPPPPTHRHTLFPPGLRPTNTPRLTRKGSPWPPSCSGCNAGRAGPRTTAGPLLRQPPPPGPWSWPRWRSPTTPAVAYVCTGAPAGEAPPRRAVGRGSTTGAGCASAAGHRGPLPQRGRWQAASREPFRCETRGERG